VIEFGSPTALLLFPAGVLFLLLASLRSRSDLSETRSRLSFLVRSALLFLLTAAVARPALPPAMTLPAPTIFLLDVSGSVSDESLEKAIRLVEAESAGRTTALIAFAGRAELLRPLSPDPLVVPREKIFEQGGGESGIRRGSLDPSRTDFASALRLASTLGLRSAKWVLFTDGRDPLSTFPESATVTVRIVEPGSGPTDAALVGIRNPLAIRSGEPFDARVDVVSGGPGTAEVTLRLEKRQWRMKNVDLPGGATTILFPNLVTDLPGGAHTLQAFVKADGDPERRNNFRTAPLIVVGRPRVLILEDSPDDSRAVVRMLRAHRFEVHPVPVDRMDQVSLDLYNAVVSAGVRGTSFTPGRIRALDDYIRNGGGFWFIARPDPDAGAEYAASPVSRLLPVEFLPTPPAANGKEEPKPREGKKPGKERRPSPTVALLMVIDKSGSMAGEKLELVKEACRVTAETLTAQDSVGVLAFDARPRWVLSFTSPARKEHIRDRIFRLLADGGTDIYPALAEAHRALTTHPRARSAGIRHVILFSDGDTRAADFRGLVGAMAEAGITVSTVCILRGRFDPILMNDIAHVGKGRFTSTGSFAQIPKIFTEEARTLLREARSGMETEAPAPALPEFPEPPEVEIPRGKIHPRVEGQHVILWDRIPEKLPPLSGILKTRPRENARTPLVTESGDALLSIGRLGLGKVAAWTSDLAGIWSAGWIGWIPFGPELFAQLVRHLSDAGRDLDFAGRVSISPGRMEDSVRIVTGSAPEKISLLRTKPSRKTIPLRTSIDGTLFAILPHAGEPGSYRLRRTSGEVTETLPFTLAPPCEPEYSAPGEKRLRAAVFKTPAAVEKGEASSLLPWLLLAALALLPFDVAIRRWR
jgi:Mg-chelatase subunit ChlD